MKRRKFTKLSQISQSLSIAVGIILIWRGVWYIADAIDIYLFNGYHAGTALAGIVIGLLLLYWPHKDFEALDRL